MSERRAESASLHAEAVQLLPWLANGTLAAEERERTEAHLESCAACREELALWRDMSAELARAEESAPAPHPVQLERLLGRLEFGVVEAEDPDELGSVESSAPPARVAAWPRAARWVLAAQFAALALLAVATFAPRSWAPVPYRTLADPAPPAAGSPELRVVFDPATSEARVRELLRSIGAEIVAGPSPLGVYTLSLPARDTAEPLGWVVEHLRSQREIRFVEPARGGAAP